MISETKRDLLAWFFGHFWGQCAGVLAGLCLLGFLLGLCRLPSSKRHNMPVSVMELNRVPGKYEARSVCVTGEVLDLRIEDNRLVRPYTVFSLKETSPDGSYDFINVISLRLPTFGKGAHATVCGFFNTVKQVGKDTYYNSILMNRFDEEK
ncbi:MAG: hypothetical protein A2081_02635 [Elusimicrobia bacterium GWC2_61_19]|nr:MAG: hypothetical protein A2081_02635 [Elusimicrobia bacterium GWC2_61_19]